jgi:hypothetical protein
MVYFSANEEIHHQAQNRFRPQTATKEEVLIPSKCACFNQQKGN